MYLNNRGSQYKLTDESCLKGLSSVRKGPITYLTIFAASDMYKTLRKIGHTLRKIMYK